MDKSDAEYRLKDAAEHYFKARSYPKMRKAYMEYFCLFTWYGVPRDSVQQLKAAEELGTFMQDVLRIASGPSLDEQKTHAFVHLLEMLCEEREYSHVADVLFRFRDAQLSYFRTQAIRGLLDLGDIQRAIEICRTLAKGKGFTRHNYAEIAKLFTEAKAYKAAAEIFCIEAISEPWNAVHDGAGVLGDLPEWKSFLSYVLEKNPLKLGEALKHIAAKITL